VRTAIDGERSLQNAPVAAVPPLPVAIGEHHGVRGAWRIVSRRKPAPDFGAHTERRQDSLARRQRPDLLGIALADDRRRCPGAPDAQILKRLSILRICQVDRVGEVRLIDAADRMDDPNQRVRFGVG
jgi:hypothetical protein